MTVDDERDLYAFLVVLGGLALMVAFIIVELVAPDSLPFLAVPLVGLVCVLMLLIYAFVRVVTTLRKK